MLDSVAANEIKKVTACENRTISLRDRWDLDFDLFTLVKERYQIPKDEGTWEYAPVTSAVTDGNRMIDLLTHAKEKLQIAITDEKFKDRKDLVATEQAALGLLFLADKINEDDPEGASVRAQDSAFAVLRGWTCDIAILTDDDDGELFPHLKPWDPRNTYWIYGFNRLSWITYVRFANPAEVKDEYPGWNGANSSLETFTDKSENLILIHDIYECEKGKKAQHGVAINNEWVVEPEDVTVGRKPLLYIPARIKAGRSLPLINGKTTSQKDNIKYVGESFLANTRELLPLESRLFSYRITQAGDLAKSANVVGYEGSKSNNKPPEGFEKHNKKGRTIYLDKDKGQELLQRMTPPQGTEIGEAMGQTIAMRSAGSGLGPVAYGQPPYPSTAQGTDIINHNILDAIKPFKKLIQDSRVWQAEELIRQLKLGGFDNQDFTGYDFRGKRFDSNIKAKDIDDNWHFECELAIDLVRDENLHVGMAATEVKTGLLSKQTARDRHNLVDDPDHEQDIIDRETASEVGELALLKTAKELWEDGTEFGKLQASMIFMKIMGAQQQQQPEGQPGAGAQPGVIAPEATAGAARTARTAQPSIPKPVVEAARRSQDGLS